MRVLWVKKEGRFRELLFFSHSGQFDGSVIVEPLKRCNIQINLLRIPLFGTYTNGLEGLYKMMFKLGPHP